MSYEQLLNQFIVFHMNAMNYLVYLISENKWTLLSVIGAVSMVVMNLMEEVEDVVTDRQNIL